MNLRGLWLLVACCWAAFGTAEELFPAGSGVVNLTLAPYSADPTGVVDATAAIQQALDDHPNGNRILYLPNGTYKVSNTLRWAGTGGNAMKRTILQGQSRDGVVLRLIDNAPGFDNPAAAKAVILTGIRPAQRFRNAVRDLTVHTGSGNPGASGIQFYTSNQGGIFRVKIISGDGQGVSGLDMAYPDVNENGPMLVQDLEVVGFNYGVNATDFINSMTFERLVLRDQKKYGLRVWAHVLSVRGMTFSGDVPAVFTAGGCAVSILDGVFSGSGAASALPAIEHRGAGLYLRNVRSTGYDRLVKVYASPLGDVMGDVEGEWSHGGGYRLFETLPPRSLQLLVKDAPALPVTHNFAADWASPMAFGAVGNGVADDTAELQAAIDSGARVVYLDGGKTFYLTGTVYLRGNLERLVGLEGNVAGNVVFELGSEGTAPVVLVERIRNFVGNGASIRHNSSRTLVLRNLSDFAITGDGSGDFFLEDVVGGPVVFNNPSQHIWARQLNAEQKTQTKIRNHGASLWILGLKTENRTTAIRTDSGGVTEVIGALIYANDSTAPTDPIFESEDAETSYVGVGEYVGGYINDFPVFVREVRAGVVRQLLDDALPGRVNAANRLPLFAGHERTGTAQLAVEISAPAFVELPASMALEAQVSGATATSIVWRKTAGPGTVVFSPADAAATSASFSDPGTYTLEVEATASGGVVATDAVTVIVYAEGTDFPPMVEAGPDQSLQLSPFSTAKTEVAGTASDPEGGALRMRWSAEGPGPVIFADANQADTALEVWQPGLYTLTLTVSDGVNEVADSLYLSVEAGYALGEGRVRYRQNFSNVPGGSLSFTTTDWRVFRADTGSELGATGTVSARIRRDGVGGDIGASTGTGINSQPTPDAPIGTGGYLIHQSNGSTTLVSITTGFSWEEGVFDSAELVWRSATAATSVGQRVLVRIGGEWYASAQRFDVIGSTDFAVRSLVLDPAAANWLNVNGDVGGSGALSLGSAPAAALAGEVSGFGLWQEVSVGSVYVDRVEILADPAPQSVADGRSTAGWRMGNSGEVNRAFWRPLAEGGFRMEDGADGKHLMLQQEFDGMRMRFAYRGPAAGAVFDSGHLIRQPFNTDVFRSQIGMTHLGYGGVFGNTITLAGTGANIPRVNAQAFPEWNDVELTVFPSVAGVQEVQLRHNGVLAWTGVGGGIGWTEDLRYGVGFQGEVATMDVKDVSVAPLGVFPPRVYAGADQEIAAGAVAALSGAVLDLDSPSLQTTWTKAAGPGTVGFANAGLAATTASFSANGMYELRLEAFDGQLRSVDYVRIQVGPPSLPAAPGALTLLIRDSGGPLIQAPDLSLNEEGFVLQRRPASGGDWQTVAALPRNEPGTVDAGLGVGRFEYRLQSWNAAGASAWSSGILLHDVPPAVGNLAAVRQADATKVDLSWTLDAEARVSEHWIYARNDGAVNWTLLTKRGGANTSYTDTQAAAGVARSYRILSRNALGEGPEATASVPGDGGGGADVTPPSAPGGLAASAVTRSGFQLAWTAASDNVGVAGYRVQIGAEPVIEVAGTQHTVTGRAPDTDHSVSVRAVDAAGNVGPAAGPITVRTLVEGGGGGTAGYLQNFSTATPGTSIAVTGTDWSFYRVDTGAQVTGTGGTVSVRIRGATVYGETGASQAAGLGALPDPDLAVGSPGYAILQFNGGGGFLAVTAAPPSNPEEFVCRVATPAATTRVRLAVKVSGQWYLAAAEQTRTGPSGFAELTKAYDPAAANWVLLTGQAGSSGLGIGGPAPAALTGAFQGFGYWISFEGGDNVYLDRVSWQPAPPVGYAAWSAGRAWPSPGDDAPGEDPDVDGITNFLEYAFGSDPLQAGDAAGPVLHAASGAGITLDFPARIGAPDLGYHVLYSPDLVQWLAHEGPVTVADPDPHGDGSFELRRTVVPLPSGWTRMFGVVDVRVEP